MTETAKGASENKLTGRVAQILNERELVINIGSQAGVSNGMKFAILAEAPLKIIDPVTKELLDTIDRTKVCVKAHEVKPKVSICRTYETIGDEYSQIFAASRWLESLQPKVETLRADNSSLPKPLTPEESYVKINDRVIQIDD